MQQKRLACPIMTMLLRRVVATDHPLDSHENRTRLGMLEGWVSTVLSLLLCLLKGWLGVVSGSVSLLADATNNLTDVGSSLVVALGFQWSRKPSDAEHPFGHGRIEAVATLVLSIALLVVGVEVAKSGVGRLIEPLPVDAPMWLVAVVGITVVVKVWLAVFTRSLAKLTRSHVLEADAWNHIFDVVSTLLVVIALVGTRLGWISVDGWAALFVAIFIFVTGVKYAREAIDILLGKKPDAEELEAIHEIVDAVDGVMGVHEIVVHHYGDVRMVSFHVEVPATLSVIDAHHIAEEAEDAVERQLEWRALAHVDPVDRSHPLFEEFHRVLSRHVAVDVDLSDFHDLRAAGEGQPYTVSFDLVTSVETSRDRYEAIYDRLQRMVYDRFQGRIRQMEVGVEAPLDSSPMVRKVFEIPGCERK